MGTLPVPGCGSAECVVPSTPGNVVEIQLGSNPVGAPNMQRSQLMAATGGSGHAVKFGSILGDVIVNAVEGKEDWRLDKFH